MTTNITDKIAKLDRKLVRLLTCKVAEWFADKVQAEILLEAIEAGRKIAAGELTFTDCYELRCKLDGWQTKSEIEQLAQWAAKRCLDQCDFRSVGNMVRITIEHTTLTEAMVLEMLQEVVDGSA